MTETMTVEVAYALPERQELIRIEVVPGTTLYEAACQSGIDRLFPGLDLTSADMGVFGKAVRNPREQVLRPGDRVEIYRPLKIDPKQARLERARKTQGGDQ